MRPSLSTSMGISERSPMKNLTSSLMATDSEWVTGTVDDKRGDCATCGDTKNPCSQRLGHEAHVADDDELQRAEVGAAEEGVLAQRVARRQDGHNAHLTLGGARGGVPRRPSGCI